MPISILTKSFGSSESTSAKGQSIMMESLYKLELEHRREVLVGTGAYSYLFSASVNWSGQMQACPGGSSIDELP